jgi:hypothetical protein
MILLLSVTMVQSNYSGAAAKKATRVSQLAHAVTGVVQTGIMTAGGDCPHKYWLKVESGGPTATRVALEPEDKVKPDYVDKRVKIEGKWDICHGTENDFPVLKIDTITPSK